MRLYPAAPRPLRATIAADLLALVLLAVFAVLAVQVHDGVDQLAQIGQGVEEAGGSIQGAFESAANGVDGLPLVGGQLAETLRSAGDTTAGRAIAYGRDGQEGVHDLAKLLGWVTFVIPALLVAAGYLPRRVRQVRRLSAAARALDATAVAEHEELLARRAVLSLPYADLLRHTRDPFGDLQRGHTAPLVAAALEEAGIRTPRAR
jgi:hypothetical protein